MGKDHKSEENPWMISAVTGGPVEGLLYEPRRKKLSRSFALGFYPMVFLLLWLLPARLPNPAQLPDVHLPNLVFLAEPGPGGGGGGGGENSPEPPSVQKRAGEDLARLALKTETPKEELIYEDEEAEEPEDEPVEEEPEEDEIKAPVVAQAPNEMDQKGTLEGPLQILESAGAGDGGGAGNGAGTGIGPGEGPGLGPGYGGGFGGGAYRIGSGVTPPILKRQVKPAYTDKALARKIDGMVVLEIVILKDGTVGPVRITQSLDPDLDRKAIEAVRMWLFAPGKFRGEPVDVIAEVQVDFTLL